MWFKIHRKGGIGKTRTEKKKKRKNEKKENEKKQETNNVSVIQV